MFTLADAATANGNYPAAAGIAPGVRDAVIVCQGVFNGATMALQVSTGDSVWTAVLNGSFTAAGTLRLQLGEGMYVRGVITSAGASTSLTLKGS